MLQSARHRGDELGCVPIGPGGGATLRFLAAATNARAVVEVGTGAGVSGLWLLRGMRRDGVLTTVDRDPEHQRAAKQAFGEAGLGASTSCVLLSSRRRAASARSTSTRVCSTSGSSSSGRRSTTRSRTSSSRSSSTSSRRTRTRTSRSTSTRRAASSTPGSRSTTRCSSSSPTCRRSASGMAMSMGAVVLAGGTPGKRMALPHSKILIHQGSAGFSGQPTEIEIQAKEVISLKRLMEEIMSKHTGQDDREGDEGHGPRLLHDRRRGQGIRRHRRGNRTSLDRALAETDDPRYNESGDGEGDRR